MSKTERTILIVDDSPEDRELYRRYLQKDNKYSYHILEASLGRQGLELWQQHQPDVMLLDYRLPDLDGLEFLVLLSSLKQVAFFPAIVVTGQGNETIAVKAMKAGAQDYLVKGQITAESLQLTINRTIEKIQLRTQLQQSIERERVMLQITKQIHQSLDLDRILKITVEEVRKFLQTDRVVILRLQPDGWGKVVTESVGKGWTSLLNSSLYEPCLNKNYIDIFRQGNVSVKTDLEDDSKDPCYVKLLSGFQVKASLVVPILHQDRLWGMAIAHHCQSARKWQPFEIDLLKDLTTQVGIAIKQAELYQNLQTELAERKRIEAEREKLLVREQAAREEAEQANNVKDLFLAILSHELRSPLTPILGWTLLLKNYSSERVKLDRGLSAIERHAKLLLKLIDDLLDVSRIWRGKITLNPAPVNLIDAIQASIETFNAAAEAKSIEIQTNLKPVGRVNADSTRLQQLIGNLLSNAIKFTDNGGRIEVKLTEVNNSAQIIVSDNGKGIDSQFLPHVFEYFLQDDGSITRKYGGLGLGLAIVRHLVELHGGVVEVTSEGLGCGATFIVSLPLLEAKPFNHLRDRLWCWAEHDRLNNANTLEPDLKGVRILLVEDDRDHLDFLTALLSSYQADLTPLSSAQEALSVLENFIPDLIISDIAMPDMDGLTFMKSIRSRSPDRGGKIPAIALTAHASNEDRELAMAAGFQTHLSKPLNINSLTISILQVLQN
jgi:signal transduction histidine kinase/DNA-binding response OmpR family regulator